jgi:hypothetical protein
MIGAENISESEERRVRVVGDRVACSRIGSVDLDRCRECVYLLRLEEASVHRVADPYVVCANRDWETEFDFAW